MQSSPLAFHPGSVDAPPPCAFRAEGPLRWVFSAVHTVSPFHEYFFYIFVCLKFNFLYILLYIEILCTMLILHKRYAHGTFAAGRAYMPTQGKKDLGL